MNGAPRVTIAGAGALGLTTALALADAGCAVTVCDPGADNASGVAAGMIAPVFEAVLDPEARGAFDLLMAARDLWPGLAARAGIALDRSGAIAVGEAQWMAGVARGLYALGLRPTEIPAATAQGLAPGLSEACGPALMTREDWRVDARSALAALRSASEAAGVIFRDGVVDARPDDGVLVVATGASTNLEGLAPELARLSPIKGHIVRFRAPARGVSVRTEGAYAAPGDGALAIGATMQPGHADNQVDPKAAEPLAAAGRRLFPGLEGAPYEIAVGVRAATPDGAPMVGRSLAPAVILAVGARRNGWLLAPLVAHVVTACVMERDPGPYAGRLDPARFGEAP
jgi:glycine oxidase